MLINYVEFCLALHLQNGHTRKIPIYIYLPPYSRPLFARFYYYLFDFFWFIFVLINNVEFFLGICIYKIATQKKTIYIYLSPYSRPLFARFYYYLFDFFWFIFVLINNVEAGAGHMAGGQNHGFLIHGARCVLRVTWNLFSLPYHETLSTKD